MEKSFSLTETADFFKISKTTAWRMVNAGDIPHYRARNQIRIPESAVRQFIARGGSLTILEGEWPHSRLVIIEFPSRAAAECWYKSDEYQKIIGLRHDSSIGNVIIIDGHID